MRYSIRISVLDSWPYNSPPTLRVCVNVGKCERIGRCRCGVVWCGCCTYVSTYVCVLVQNLMLPLVDWPYVYINRRQLQYGCSHRCSMIRILCTLLCGYAGKPRGVLVFQVKVAFPF